MKKNNHWTVIAIALLIMLLLSVVEKLEAPEYPGGESLCYDKDYYDTGCRLAWVLKLPDGSMGSYEDLKAYRRNHFPSLPDTLENL